MTLPLALAAAFLFGVSKTGIPSVGSLGAAVLAMSMPALASTGVALPLLLGGTRSPSVSTTVTPWARSCCALCQASLPAWRRGFAVIRFSTPSGMARVIGAILLLAAAGELVRRRAGADERAAAHHSSIMSRAFGAGAGLATMVANAGGPMMTLYLLRMRVTGSALMGTVAWFFFVVNVTKVPFSVGLGLITPTSLRQSALLVPALVAGAGAGYLFVRRVSTSGFETAALVATLLGGALLLLR